MEMIFANAKINRKKFPRSNT